ncbi:MAG: 7-carboxy-7-deazaguanine synthase QueE [Nitrospirota bacterium]
MISLQFRKMFCTIICMKHAGLCEVFSSIQGEGPWVGQRQIFVRFAGCDIRCRYCDTVDAFKIQEGQAYPQFCGVQISAGTNEREQATNPISSLVLTKFCNRLVIPGPSRPVISLTGGEPLLQASFLMEWLPMVRNDFTLYLETNGIHTEDMRLIYDLVDVVSIDFKLPSSTGLRPFWDDHTRFLELARGKKLYVKVVVTRDTRMEDILIACKIIERFDRSTVLVIQPASGPLKPDSSMLLDYQQSALKIIEDVRVIPQTHKKLNVP